MSYDLTVDELATNGLGIVVNKNHCSHLPFTGYLVFHPCNCGMNIKYLWLHTIKQALQATLSKIMCCKLKIQLILPFCFILIFKDTIVKTCHDKCQLSLCYLLIVSDKSCMI